MIYILFLLIYDWFTIKYFSYTFILYINFVVGENQQSVADSVIKESDGEAPAEGKIISYL